MTGGDASAPLLVDSTGGARVAVHDLGGQGRPLLLVHANGFCGHTLEPLARRLAGVHLWAVDLRGHGDSPLPEEHLADWQDAADDALAAAGECNDGTPVLGVGHSMGGAALALAEVTRPGTFGSLYLYEPVIFPPPESGVAGTGNPLAAAARRRREHFPDRESARANYAGKPPLDVLHPEALDAYVDHGFRPDPDRGGITLKCRPEREARNFEAPGPTPTWDRMGEIRCPVTVARGAKDPYGPAAFAPAVAERLPHGQLVEHPDLGHFGPMQDPATIAAEIDAALG